MAETDMTTLYDNLPDSSHTNRDANKELQKAEGKSAEKVMVATAIG